MCEGQPESLCSDSLSVYGLPADLLNLEETNKSVLYMPKLLI